MLRIALLLFCGLLATATAAEFGGKLILKDASNEDVPVGAAAHGPNVGIPQGHTLKVVVQEVRHGRRMAGGAAVNLRIAHGDGEPVATASGLLDENGYGEFLVLVDDDWPLEVYQARVAIDSPVGRTSRRDHLQSTFRAVEGEPAPEVPEAWPALLLLLATVGFALWLRRPAPLSL